MSDGIAVIEPRTLEPDSKRREIAPVPNCLDAAGWCHNDPPIPRWPLWIVSIVAAALIVGSINLPLHTAKMVAGVIGYSNALWLFWVLFPAAVFLWIASDRLLRHARRASKTLESAYYVAWSSVSSWKPDIQKSGIDELVALGTRKANVGESLRHLKWGLWAFETACVAVAAGVAISAHHGLIAWAGGLRVIAAILLFALGSAVVAKRIGARSRSLCPTENQLTRATMLYQECQDERERRWRFI